MVWLTEAVKEGLRLPLSEALLLRVPLAVKEPLPVRLPEAQALPLWDREALKLALRLPEPEALPEALLTGLGAATVALALPL